jgi:hypothetical protein
MKRMKSASDLQYAAQHMEPVVSPGAVSLQQPASPAARPGYAASVQQSSGRENKFSGFIKKMSFSRSKPDKYRRTPFAADSYSAPVTAPASPVVTPKNSFMEEKSDPGVRGRQRSDSSASVASVASSNASAPPVPPKNTNRRSYLRLEPTSHPHSQGAGPYGGGDEEREVLEERAIAGDSGAVIDPKVALRTVMAYLRDLDDLSSSSDKSRPTSTTSRHLSTSSSRASASGHRNALSRSISSSGRSSTYQRTKGEDVGSPASGGSGEAPTTPPKLKDDNVKREAVVSEICSSERSYLRGLEEVVEIYVDPSASPAKSSGTSTPGGTMGSKESVVPLSERRAVFSNIANLAQFHKAVFLPDLEEAAASMKTSSRKAADNIAMVFIRHAAYLKMYHQVSNKGSLNG